MKRIFLDTNILLDYGLDRELADYAGNILELGREGHIELYASYLSFAATASTGISTSGPRGSPARETATSIGTTWTSAIPSK